MFKTPNMGLKAWDLSKDYFTHSELAENFKVIDVHNHSKGRGVQLSGESLNDESIENKQIAKEAVSGEKVEKHSLGAEQIETGFLPLGAVIDWYRKPGTNTEPGPNWLVCDGSKNWSEVPNDLGYTTGPIPNFIGQFRRGGTIEDIGTTGGSNTVNLAHSHTVTSHTHEVGAHTHSVGGHTHNIQGHTHGLSAHSHGISSDLGVLGFQFSAIGGPPFYSLFQTKFSYTPGSTDAQILRFANTSVNESTELPMQSAGHSHGGSTASGGSGNTNASSPFDSAENTSFNTGNNSTFSSGAAAPTTNSQLGSISLLPSYTELLPIMKIK
jgi:hypothetical protein